MFDKRQKHLAVGPTNVKTNAYVVTMPLNK
jgi:hypothetical protein